MGTEIEQARAEALPESKVSVDAVEGFEVNEPSVTAVMLVDGRVEMTERALRSFHEQTYENKALIVFATSGSELRGIKQGDVLIAYSEIGRTIGTLRNEANLYSRSDIILHFDSDDWSHPNRISEQVALLQSSGADAVGYREMLFWKQIPGNLPHGQAEYECGCGDCRGEAWLYANNDPRYIVGSSLCYWRAAWERQPFKDVMRGEDYEFVKGLKSVGLSANHSVGFHVPMRDVTMGGLLSPADVVRRFSPMEPKFRSGDSIEPRMICSIHGGNTCGYTEATLTGSINWRRVPEWDSKLREVMSL